MAPHLSDYGQRPELDLHGCTVDDAMALVHALIVKSTQRGRDSIKIVHGSSTTRRNETRRTIKRALHELLDSGRMHLHIAYCLRENGYTIVSLRSRSGRKDTRRITMNELRQFIG